MKRRRLQTRTMIPLLLIPVLLLLTFHFIRSWNDHFSDAPREIAVVLKTVEPMEFWQVLAEGVDVAAREFGVQVTVTGPDKEVEVDRQIRLLKEVIRKRPDAVVLAATDYKRLVPVTRSMNEAGIPFVLIDSGIDSDLAHSFIATDNIEAGKKAGRMMVELTGTRAQIAIISFVQGTTTQMEREQGVRQHLEQHPEIDIIGSFYSDGEVDKAYRTTRELLETHPDLDGIVALNEPSSIGAGRAIRELGRTGEVKLVGFDSSIDEVKLLEEGVMQATVVQRPFNMGYLGLKTAVQILNGETVPETIDTGSVVITKKNMYTDENQKLLFPFVKE